MKEINPTYQLLLRVKFLSKLDFLEKDLANKVLPLYTNQKFTNKELLTIISDHEFYKTLFAKGNLAEKEAEHLEKYLTDSQVVARYEFGRKFNDWLSKWKITDDWLVNIFLLSRYLPNQIKSRIKNPNPFYLKERKKETKIKTFVTSEDRKKTFVKIYLEDLFFALRKNIRVDRETKSDFNFSFQAWHPFESEADYRKRLFESFKMFSDKYLEKRSKEISQIPISRNKESLHLDWLIEYHFKGKERNKIGDNKDAGKQIGKMAILLDFTLRKPKRDKPKNRSIIRR
jgi:hypothetical protein